MHVLRSLFYLTNALHVSGVTITHIQGYKTTLTTPSCNLYTLLLSAAIVEELYRFVCVVGAVSHPQHTQISSNLNCIVGL
jgi:hypothetical protein